MTADAEFRVSSTTLVYWLVVLAVAVLVLLPIGYVGYAALQSGDPIMDPDRHWTLGNLIEVVTSSRYLQALINTGVLAVVVAVSSTAAGGIFAWAIARTDMPGRDWLETAMTVPIYLSPFVGALAWMFLASPRSGFLNVWAQRYLGFDGPIFNVMSAAGVAWVMFLFFTSQAFMLIIGALRSMDRSLEEASSMVGAGVWRTLFTVTFPLIRPALLSTFFLIFVLAAEMFSVPGLLGAPVGFLNLPFVIYSDVKFYPPRFPQGAAASLLLLVIMGATLILYRWAIRNASRFVTVSARGFRPGTQKLGPTRYVLTGAIVLFFSLAVVVPYLTLILASLLRFVTPNLRVSLFTFDNYTAIFASSEILRAVTNTGIIALVGATAAVVLGALVAFMSERVRARGTRLLDYVAMFPIAIPGVLLGIGLAIAYLTLPVGIYGTIWILILAYIAANTPYAIRVSAGGLLQIDRSLEEASRVVGASDMYTLRRITGPLLRPALISVWLLIVISIIREVSAAIILVSSQSSVVSVVMWHAIENGSYGQAAAIGLLQTVVLVVLIAFVGMTQRRASRAQNHS